MYFRQKEQALFSVYNDEKSFMKIFYMLDLYRDMMEPPIDI